MTSNNLKLIRELEELVNESIDPSMFPYQKGNSIRIGAFIVRCNKRGFYKVYDSQANKLVTEAFCKSSAVAIAKNLSQGKRDTTNIVKIDKDIQKWYNDCIFYKHSMRKTTDSFKYDIILNRYEIAKDKTCKAKEQLDKYIYV
jgi:hypothetical protein